MMRFIRLQGETAHMPAIREIYEEAGVKVDVADDEGRWVQGAALVKRHGAATVRYVIVPYSWGNVMSEGPLDGSTGVLEYCNYMWLANHYKTAANEEWTQGGRGARHVWLLRVVFTDNETSVRRSSLFSLLQLRFRGRIEAALRTQPFCVE